MCTYYIMQLLYYELYRASSVVAIILIQSVFRDKCMTIVLPQTLSQPKISVYTNLLKLKGWYFRCFHRSNGNHMRHTGDCLGSSQMSLCMKQKTNYRINACLQQIKNVPHRLTGWNVREDNRNRQFTWLLVSLDSLAV